MHRIIAKNRNKAFKNQKGLCYYCNKPIWENNIQEFASLHGLTIKEASRMQCTAEHLKAKCDGGLNSAENIVASCLFCNQTRHRIKKAPSPTQYMIQIRKQMLKGGWHKKAIHRLSTSPT